MSEVATTIARNAKGLRKRLGLTLQQTADRGGLAKSYVWEIENGRNTNPSITTLIGLCSALGCSLDALVGREVYMKPQLRPEAMRIAVEVDSLLRAELIKTKHEQIARLTEERDEWEKACEANTAMGASVAEMWKDKAERYKDTALAEAEAMEDQKSRALAAEAQVQALREALEPFAKAADDGEGMLRDGGYPFPADDAPAGYEQRHGGYVQMTPLWGHLRRARAALRSEP